MAINEQKALQAIQDIFVEWEVADYLASVSMADSLWLDWGITSSDLPTLMQKLCKRFKLSEDCLIDVDLEEFITVGDVVNSLVEAIA